ncbi:MAG TPA: hypothetical protein VM198_14175 [Longimicrobiales bacterium]|nr:hypothetical protein [Longimicrobiales bacterium]
MDPRGARRRGIVLTWIRITVAWAAAVVIEVLVLTEGVGAAIAATSLVALVAGVLITRRALASRRQPLITVRDLRRK